MYQGPTTKKVSTFHLHDEEDRERYEELLNDPNVEVDRDEFTYTKTGNEPIITI